MTVHSIQLGDVSGQTSQYLWLHVCDTDQEAQNLANLDPASLVVSRASDKIWKASAAGAPVEKGSAAGGGATKDNHYYKQVGTSPLERWYVAGMSNATALTTGSPAINTLIAIPFVAPRGGSVDRLGVEVTTLNATGVMRVGIYSATSDTNLYPSALVTGSDPAQLTATTAGVKAHTFGTPLVITAGTLYWFAYTAGTAAVAIRALAVGGMEPILGVGATIGAAPGVGLSVARAFAALPATFPASAAAVTAAPIPAIACRFSA